MDLNKSDFTLTNKHTQKKEGRSLSGLTVQTSGSIVLVYIARRGSADAQSFDKVGGLHLAGNCHWRGHAEPFNPKLNVGHVRFDAAALPSPLANRGGKNSAQQWPSDGCRIEILCNAEKIVFVLID